MGQLRFLMGLDADENGVAQLTVTQLLLHVLLALLEVWVDLFEGTGLEGFLALL
jgi:hypothetical protein